MFPCWMTTNFVQSTPYTRNHDGAIQKWYPKSWYGSPAKTIQDILTAYTVYRTLNASQMGKEQPATVLSHHSGQTEQR